MRGSELVELWEQQHGQLSVESQLRFLASSEAQKIRAAPAEYVVLALRRTPVLSEVLSDLINAGLLDAEDSPVPPIESLQISPKQRQPGPVRKIAARSGRGFRQAEEDQRNWRRRF